VACFARYTTKNIDGDSCVACKASHTTKNIDIVGKIRIITLMSLTRADLEANRLQQLITQANLGIHVLSEAELQESLNLTLSQNPNENPSENPSEQVWVFAYGSLIWNPVIDFVDRQIGTIHGWHRRFCLWTPLGRGTPENPGLVLGLDRGGSCRGVIYQIAPELVQTELLLIWRREMVVGSYIPQWVKVITPERTLYAIAFLINRTHHSYAGAIDQATTVRHLATARGALGPASDYLHQTIASLAQAGIRDRGLRILQQQVMAYQMPDSEIAPAADPSAIQKFS
jgi:glutathione-specific gamma-glutamylcyclotransferase